MKRRNAVVVIISSLALGACQSPEPESLSAETQKLEQRVAELEAALAEKNSGEQPESEPAQPAPAAPAVGTVQTGKLARVASGSAAVTFGL